MQKLQTLEVLIYESAGIVRDYKIVYKDTKFNKAKRERFDVYVNDSTVLKAAELVVDRLGIRDLLVGVIACDTDRKVTMVFRVEEQYRELLKDY